MELASKLIGENIDPEKLQKGLKCVGHNLPEFEGIREEHVPNLIELFKIAVDIDLKTKRNIKWISGQNLKRF
ncbi:MAG: hypothetical protein IPN33_00240 [Saprospiraceae bacterium]|nr:hypothetical protein [Saprospiraceae bacterium]